MNSHCNFVEPQSDGCSPDRPRITIVGAGNWLVSHDRIGPKILQLCSGRYGPEVELFDSGSAGLAVLDSLRGQELMLIVDACHCGGGRGQVTVQEFGNVPPSSCGPSIHQIGPVETLTVAKHLYPEKMPRQILFILVETEDLDEKEIDSACDRIMAVLDREIAKWHRNYPQ